MSWRDYLSEQEEAELTDVDEARQQAITAYKSVYRKLKIRCDTRMLRDPDKEKDKP